MGYKNYVIDTNGSLSVRRVLGQTPRNVIAEVPENIPKTDWQYLQATPIYDPVVTNLVIGYDISVDSAAKAAGDAIKQTEMDARAMRLLRAKRNALLAETDYTQILDAPLTGQEKSDYTTYRQALRDFPSNVVDVHNPVWPTKPGS